MAEGIRTLPDAFPGLRPGATFRQVQESLHLAGRHACQVPCPLPDVRKSLGQMSGDGGAESGTDTSLRICVGRSRAPFAVRGARQGRRPRRRPPLWGGGAQRRPKGPARTSAGLCPFLRPPPLRR
ncbi:unnamed protein product [Prorocentrum cordatum]|uniref:Uncharacterized protein n=1 Tax=Prorocentrum cordatum TaxID=2364126 RepID=A0ABN9ULW4_9DINO|nr:unnamed protein product [Polarella glacialis]